MASRNLNFAGIFTWLLVALMHLMWAVRSGFLFTAAGALWSVSMVAFLGIFLYSTRGGCGALLRHGLIALQSVLVITCIVLQPEGFLPVLLVVVAGQLGHLRTAAAMVWITIQSMALCAILLTNGDEIAVPMALAYFAFQLFGVFAARMAHEEREAKQALAGVNAELRVATGLLDMSSRAEERLRIARDLHDLIGHHLTALSLNLEVASHLANGEARDHIEKSKALTKLLLADVRDVVSRLRQDESIDLTAALHSLREVVTSPALQIEATDVTVADPELAQTALRAVQEIVTNAVRHSGARNLWVTLGQADHTLAIDARDDGSGVERVELGNGLRGMRERIEQSGGTLEIASRRGEGFEVHIRLPLPRIAS